MREEEEQKTGPFKPAQESPVVDLSGDSSYLVIFGLGHGAVVFFWQSRLKHRFMLSCFDFSRTPQTKLFPKSKYIRFVIHSFLHWSPQETHAFCVRSDAALSLQSTDMGLILPFSLLTMF